MTVFRGWNGSGWDDLQWCTKAGTYFQNPVHKPYAAPIASTSTRVANWDFAWDSLGWRYYTGAAYDGIHSMDGQSMLIGKIDANQTPWTVSPALSNAEMDSLRAHSLLAQMHFRMDLLSGSVGSYGIDIQMNADFGGPLQEDSVFLEAWGSIGWTILTGDYPLSVWQWDSPRIYLHSYCSDTSANWTLFVDWVRFIDANTGDTVWETTPYVPGIVPNVWTPGGWVPQTAP